MYLLLDGEVSLFKQPDALIKHDGIVVSSSKIPLWYHDSGNSAIGVKMGTIQKNQFLADDAVLFKQPFQYSLKTRGKALLWVCPAIKVLKDFSDGFK